MSQVKTIDVTKFLSDLIDTSMIYEVDGDGYVVRKNNGERVTRTDANGTSNLIIYQENITDASALVVNPLAEGLGATPATLWLFDTLRVAMLGRIFVVLRAIMSAALEEKNTKADKEKHLSIDILKHASKIIEVVDAKMLADLEEITEDKEATAFLTIYYQRKQLRSVLRSALFDKPQPRTPGVEYIPTWKEKHKHIRAKTWKCLETILFSVLGIATEEDFANFTKKASVISCARLSSFLNVVLSVYQEINPILAAVDSELTIDLTRFVYHMNRLEAYSDNAKFWRQPARIAAAPVDTQTPASMPGMFGIPPSQLPTPPVSVDLIPGPVYADGRPSEPIQIIHQPQNYYPQGPLLPAMPAPGTLPTGQQPMYGMQPPMYGMPQPMYGVPQPPQSQYYAPQGYMEPRRYNQPIPVDVPFAGPYGHIAQPGPYSNQGYIQNPGGPILNRYA